MKVVEIFGPTVQGEGPYAGRVCHFLRFGGCDYRCSWCDTMYAVEPALVREAEDLGTFAILARLDRLERAPMVVLSGGNPALQKLDTLIPELASRYEVVAVETQGSVWRPWLGRVDCLVVSPKPPSSGMVNDQHRAQFAAFMAEAQAVAGLALKVVVFDEEDLTFAEDIHRRFSAWPFYLSAGTDSEAEDPLPGVADRYRWLCETVVENRWLHDAVVLPQLHVVAWGSRVGV